MTDPKMMMFQTVARMLGVDPAMLQTAVRAISEAGDRLERLEAKLDRLLNLQQSGADAMRLPGYVIPSERPDPHAGPGTGNGAA